MKSFNDYYIYVIKEDDIFKSLFLQFLIYWSLTDIWANLPENSDKDEKDLAELQDDSGNLVINYISDLSYYLANNEIYRNSPIAKLNTEHLKEWLNSLTENDFELINKRDDNHSFIRNTGKSTDILIYLGLKSYYEENLDYVKEGFIDAILKDENYYTDALSFDKFKTNINELIKGMI